MFDNVTLTKPVKVDFLFFITSGLGHAQMLLVATSFYMINNYPFMNYEFTTISDYIYFYVVKIIKHPECQFN